MSNNKENRGNPSRRKSSQIKKQLYKKQNGRCFYCEQPLMDIEEKINTRKNIYLPLNYPTIDHVMPITRNGHHKIYNCVVSCYSCNQRKSNRYPTKLIIDNLTALHTQEISE